MFHRGDLCQDVDLSRDSFVVKTELIATRQEALQGSLVDVGQSAESPGHSEEATPGGVWAGWESQGRGNIASILMTVMHRIAGGEHPMRHPTMNIPTAHLGSWRDVNSQGFWGPLTHFETKKSGVL